MLCYPKSRSMRRYMQRFAVTMTAYVLSIFVAAWVFPRYHPGGLLAYCLALLPALAIIGVIVSVGLYIREEQDEFQRNLLIQSMVWAIGATLAITTTWGFLEMFVGIQHLQPFVVFPLFWFFVGIATAVLKLRYR